MAKSRKGFSAPAIHARSLKPHIRTRRTKAVPPSAFPTSRAAFPVNGPQPSPEQAIKATPGGMTTGAAPGTMTE